MIVPTHTKVCMLLDCIPTDWLSFLWVCCITFNIFWTVVMKKGTEKFEK